LDYIYVVKESRFVSYNFFLFSYLIWV